MKKQSANFGYKIAIHEPSNLKGKELKKVLLERAFPLQEVKLVSDEGNAGTVTEFDDEATIVVKADKDSLADVDVVFFCGTKGSAAEVAPMYDELGFYAFDMSRSFEPGENYRYFVAGKENDSIISFDGIHATPHSAAVPLVSFLKSLDGEFGLKLAASTIMTPVSEVGDPGITELHQQTSDLLSFKSVEGRQKIYNIFPRPEAHTEEVHEIKQQVSGLTGIDSSKLSFSVFDVPVFFGNLFSIYLEFENAPGKSYDWKSFFSSHDDFAFDGSISEGASPLGPVDIAESDKIHIQLISNEDDDFTRVWFWMLADNIRFGSVLNVVKLAEIALEL